MQTTFLILAAALAVVPASQTRSAFEAEQGKPFAVRKAVPAGLVDKSLRSGPDATEWTFVLPLDSGTRLRFAKVMFKDGKYADGTMHYFGLPEMKMTADEFSALRRKFPMAGVCANPDTPVCLLHPTETALARPVPEEQADGLGFSPVGELYGSLIAGLGRLRVKTDEIAFRVDFTDADGRTVPLGAVRNVRGKERLDQAAILKALAESYPRLVSERELTELFLKGRIRYAPVRE